MSWRSGIEANLPPPEDPQFISTDQIIQGTSSEDLIFNIRFVVYDPQTGEVKNREDF